MPGPSDTRRLGPENATLSVQTKRAGAASRAGHDLLIEVAAWEATIERADDPAESTLELTADPTSLRVREGRGGLQALARADIDKIHRTIDDEVLRRREIAFRSTAAVASSESALRVDGELTLAGTKRPIGFELTLATDGAVEARAVVRQSDWGMKPYSALFGALKVADEVEVRLSG